MGTSRCLIVASRLTARLSSRILINMLRATSDLNLPYSSVYWLRQKFSTIVAIKCYVPGPTEFRPATSRMSFQCLTTRSVNWLDHWIKIFIAREMFLTGSASIQLDSHTNPTWPAPGVNANKTRQKWRVERVRDNGAAVTVCCKVLQKQVSLIINTAFSSFIQGATSMGSNRRSHRSYPINIGVKF